ncbi:MAG: hypothetical protein OFPI_11920 [Osedax symbiont Rs2]|nr:MAG: hypothetical protein OFPI_11920 [Osedax symbiont Rs2]
MISIALILCAERSFFTAGPSKCLFDLSLLLLQGALVIDTNAEAGSASTAEILLVGC